MENALRKAVNGARKLEMNWYNILRKIVGGILGFVWGYRLDLAIKRGITLMDYLIFLIPIGILLFSLRFIIQKEKKTSDPNIIIKEGWKDIILILIILGLTFFLKQVFNLIFD